MPQAKIQFPEILLLLASRARLVGTPAKRLAHGQAKRDCQIKLKNDCGILLLHEVSFVFQAPYATLVHVISSDKLHKSYIATLSVDALGRRNRATGSTN